MVVWCWWMVMLLLDERKDGDPIIRFIREAFHLQFVH